jgi:hypothetical protein
MVFLSFRPRNGKTTYLNDLQDLLVVPFPRVPRMAVSGRQALRVYQLHSDDV